MNPGDLSFNASQSRASLSPPELPLQLFRNMQKREIEIRQVGDVTSAAAIRRTVKITLTGTPDDIHAEAGCTLIDNLACPVNLTIDAQLVVRGQIDGVGTPISFAKNVADTAAARLADVLLNDHAGTDIGSRLAGYMAAMLCERIASLLSLESSVTNCGFQSWQLARLDQTLSGDGEMVSSVADVASSCGLSACHFSRLFKATYGLPLHKYMVKKRIQKAQDQLAHTDAPISQIALDCGFADQSCFTRRFTTVAGIPPAAWRRQAKQNHEACAAQPTAWC